MFKVIVLIKPVFTNSNKELNNCLKNTYKVSKVAIFLM